ncbi:MAG: rane protein [Candidatus Saccharibacteria bacterium]|nr:rane protein [Candidatus Saccharibacteria bacterium]
MNEPTQEVRETTTTAGNTTQTTQQVVEPGREKAHKQNTAARVVWYVAGVLLTLLGIRFVLALLGANAGNGFANFIYSVTDPFVSPFISLFNYDLQAGVARFELFTLVAMAVYALIAYGISRLITINRD